MGLSKLQQIRSDGIGFIDHRVGPYYSKYNYRARLYCTGITLIWWAKTVEEIVTLAARNKKRYQYADVPSVQKFFEWKLANQGDKNNKNCNIRVEGNVASVFSNDLVLLKTLESIGCAVDFTEVDSTMPVGVKYFVNEPKFKYRIYLKSKRVEDVFVDKLNGFVTRYKDSDSKVVPSKALESWLSPSNRSRGWSTWRNRYCSSSYFFDYNEESTLTLFMLHFDNIVSKRYKLEKRPD
jgi:hypothetical protein